MCTCSFSRSIRVSNKAFQSKVACAPGGAELLVAAGYEYQTCASAAAGGPAGAGAVEEGEELFLVHSMLPDGRGKLRYTLSRYSRLHMPAKSSHVQHDPLLTFLSCSQNSRAVGECEWCSLPSGQQ